MIPLLYREGKISSKNGTKRGTSAWSLNGESVPFLDLAQANVGPPPAPSLPFYQPALASADKNELASATIPVENADAPIYLVSVTDDKRWPSPALSEQVIERLDTNEYQHEYRHEIHTDAGHYIRFPYLPTAGTRRDSYNVYGGSQESNAQANADAWHETVAFLANAFHD